MKSAPAITLWAVVATSERSERIMTDTVRDTRKAAKQAYNGGPNQPDWYKQARKDGWVRLEKVTVSLEMTR